ncbi:MAG: radical SAM protein [Methanomicrobium sp.]|nr:radical SAM protein [Methanomicrobium sp.]
MKVIEIFKSLQGEGAFQGTAAAFVRFAGCNLNCKWCDTPESRHGGIEMSHEEICGKIAELGCANICVTGGEPLIHLKALVPLLKRLHDDGYYVEIETNGTIDPSECFPYAAICMDVKCPSSGEHSDLSILAKLRPRDMVKFVVGDMTDLKYAQSIIESYDTAARLFITPVWGSDCHAIAEYILENRIPVTFQVQLHKVIDVK